MANLDGTYWYSNASGNPAQGYIITQNDADPAAAPKNISNLSYYKALISGNHTAADMRFVSEPFISLVDNTKMFAIASTVFDANNNLAGLIGCTITASSLNNEYARLLGKEARSKTRSNENGALRSSPQGAELLLYCFYGHTIFSPSGLPPSRWMCRWCTVCPASCPWLTMRR